MMKLETTMLDSSYPRLRLWDFNVNKLMMTTLTRFFQLRTTEILYIQHKTRWTLYVLFLLTLLLLILKVTTVATITTIV